MLDDLVELRTGDQIARRRRSSASTEGLEIDESLLTGESDPVDKTPGRRGAVGQLRRRGVGRFQATKVGADAYARQLAAEARRFTLVRSELVDGINTLLRLIQYALFPVAALLLWRQLGEQRHRRSAHRAWSPASSAWCPKGSCCSTSLAFGIAAVTLGAPQRARAGAARGRRARPRRRRVPRQDRHAHRGRRRVRPPRAARRRATTPTRRGGARRARRRREPQRHAAAPSARPSRSPGWTRNGAVPVLVGAQVERRELRRARLVGLRRARDDARRRTPSDPVRATADELAAEGRRVLAARAQRRRARRRDAAADARAVRARAARGEGASGRGRHAPLLRRAGRRSSR